MFWDYRLVVNRSEQPTTTSIRCWAVGRNNWTRHFHWVIGSLATVSLSILFLIGEPSFSFWTTSAALLLIWGLWAWKYLFAAFASLIFVWVTLYTRATIPMFQVEGFGNRGGIILGDLLWIIFVCVWGVQFVLSPRPAFPIMRERVNFLLLLLIPYIGLSVILPILGVLAGAPASFAIPGIRPLQWVSFAWFSYWFARKLGAIEVLKMVLIVLSLAGACHALYSLVQLLVFSKALPHAWLELDRLYAQRFAFSWFFYPRTTGLLNTPNSYGLFGAVLLIFLTALVFSKMPISPFVKAMMGVCGLCALLSSASRSGIIGLLGGVAVALLIAYLKAMYYSDWRQMGRVMGFVVKAILGLGGSIGIMLFVLPSPLLNRFVLLALTLFEGASADPNAIGRFELWQEAIQVYEERFPWGIWFPLGYVTGKPIDSYWVTLLVQGTPLYLLSFLALLLGIFWRGVRTALSRTDNSMVGYVSVGMSMMMGMASLTLSPILLPQILVPFWILVGLLLVKSKPCARFCS